MLAREIGAKVANDPADLTETSEVVVTMLADDAASEAVHYGPNGLFSRTGSTVFIEMGTMSPDHIKDLARAAPKGTSVIDAPVSGATQAAKDAHLLIMAGCSVLNAAAVMPLFDALGKKTICLGQTGAGSVMKLAVNSLIHGINQTFAARRKIWNDPCPRRNGTRSWVVPINGKILSSLA